MDYEYLNATRIQSGLTNKAIAQSQNLSESTVSRFFHGDIKAPDIPLAKAICNAIGASLDRACRLVKPIDTTMTEPMPSIPAVVTDVVQSLPPLVDEEKVAEKIAQAVAESPLVSAPIDTHALAQEIAAILPKPQPIECESCRTARLYEATILRQSKLISVLFGASGGLMLFIVALLVWLIAK